MPRSSVAVFAACVACSSGPPAGFSGAAGTEQHWTFPLVGAVEDGILIAPVTLDGRGPFLFALDPDSQVTIVDEELVQLLKLPAVKGPARIDEARVQHPRFYAEVRALELGTLIIERRDAMIVKLDTFNVNGRRIFGVLGKDVLADALVFGFDRDRGLGFLTAVDAFEPPPGSTAIPYTRVAAELPGVPVQPLDRRVVEAMVGGKQVRLHVDLGASTSQLREELWPEANLAPVDVRTAVIDEVGTTRRVSKATISDTVSVGGIEVAKLVFLPYQDTRFTGAQVDGTLGLDFFRGHDTWAAWDANTLHLVTRVAVPPQTRTHRWDVGAIARCTQPGCVTLRLIDPLAGKPVDPAKPHPGLVLSVTREEVAGGMDLEVIVEAKGRPELPRIAINLMPTADRVMQHLKAEWVGAALEVIEASPYPRPCSTGDGCIDLLAR